jgi:hypothetical protein
VATNEEGFAGFGLRDVLSASHRVSIALLKRCCEPSDWPHRGKCDISALR